MTALNSIRTWALLAVTVSSAFTIGIATWLVYILSRADWCGNILGASRYVDGRPEYAVQACADILTINATTLGRALIISIGVQALCLLVLNVIVLAGGKLSFKASKDGIDADMSGDPAVRAARQVAGAAEDEAENIEGETR